MSGGNALAVVHYSRLPPTLAMTKNKKLSLRASQYIEAQTGLQSKKLSLRA
jgi:hypothetical protein